MKVLKRLEVKADAPFLSLLVNMNGNAVKVHVYRSKDGFECYVYGNLGVKLFKNGNMKPVWTVDNEADARKEFKATCDKILKYYLK